MIWVEFFLQFRVLFNQWSFWYWGFNDLIISDYLASSKSIVQDRHYKLLWEEKMNCFWHGKLLFCKLAKLIIRQKKTRWFFFHLPDFFPLLFYLYKFHHILPLIFIADKKRSIQIDKCLKKKYLFPLGFKMLFQSFHWSSSSWMETILIHKKKNMYAIFTSIRWELVTPNYCHLPSHEDVKVKSWQVRNLQCM